MATAAHGDRRRGTGSVGSSPPAAAPASSATPASAMAAVSTTVPVTSSSAWTPAQRSAVGLGRVQINASNPATAMASATRTHGSSVLPVFTRPAVVGPTVVAVDEAAAVDDALAVVVVCDPDPPPVAPPPPPCDWAPPDPPPVGDVAAEPPRAPSVGHWLEWVT